MTNKNYKAQANRDGITLLFVISMVVLFLLMGTTFMLVSNDYYKSARYRADSMSYQVDSTSLLDRCFYDLVRGPSLADTSSPLRGHSILADQYGYGISGEVFAAPGSTMPETLSGPFVTISLSAAPPVAVFPATTPPTIVAPSSGVADAMRLVRNPQVGLDLSMDATMIAATGSTYVDDIYAGRVLSITSGALRGFSSRIISHSLVVDATPVNNRMTVVVLANGLDWTALADDDQVVINGADFSGRGAGDLSNFGGSLAALDMYNPDTIAAGGLGTNSVLVNQQGAGFDGTAGSINQNIMGFLASDQSTNESYDIPDHQNLFLGGVDAAGNPIPSFHRDTILVSQIAGAASADVWRQHTLRPIFVRDPAGATVPGTPGFPPEPAPGSSANYEFFERTLPELVTNIDTDGPISADGSLNTSLPTPVARQFSANATNNLDVDSDGDGVLDSVWIDIGLPAQTDSEGRTFKPLVAYRVVDMDGRINLNTSGTTADSITPAAAGLRGGGYGVAEITPRDFVTSYTDLLNSRYQSPEFLGQQMPPTPVPGVERDGNGNSLASGNHLGRNQKLFGYPGGAYDAADPEAMLGGSFSTGLDLFGQLQLQTVLPTTVTNPNTLPEFAIPTTTLTSAISPYQVNLGLGGSPLDNLFTPEELEGVLRANDADATFLPTRLRDLVDGVTLASGNLASNHVTTHSFEITLPATTGSLVRKLNNLLATAGVATPGARSALIDGLLSRHVLLGGKVDINRALGNGIDDNGDGVVDNESLIGVEEPTDQLGSPIADLDQDGMQETGDANARQILAQDLYITALLVCGENAPAGLTLTSGTVANLAYRQMIAQWAVNVVDFRDPDSIMTGFEVDLMPFDATGWEVDGDLTTDTYVDSSGSTVPDAGANKVIVWGAERPELLITETFAYHDRRTEDLSMDNGDNDNFAGDDDDWDSRQVPQSGAFFELYHPWGEVDEITRLTPEELGSGGVDLGQSTPNDDPVWRLGLRRTRADAMFARAVYFYDVNTARPALMNGVAGDFFFTTLGTKTVAPGEYAVIGSSGNVGVREGTGALAGPRYETTFGRLTASAATVTVTDADISITRAIGLDLVNNRVIRRDGTGMETADEDGDGDEINDDGGPAGEAADLAKTIAINSPRSLSISDPNGGYTALLTAAGASIAGSGDGQQILPVMDTPLDSGAAANDIDAIWTNGVTDNFRFAYLQRLANPLLDHNPLTNPYLTIDTAGVDLLAFNGMEANSDNGNTLEAYVDGGGVAKAVIDGGTFLKSVERGESKHGAVVDATLPKQNLFASEEGNQVDPGTDGTGTVVAGDGHNLSYSFTETFGGLNNSYSAFSSGGTGATTPFGWLTWNNRPFASAAEIANVPYHSSEWLCYFFNEGTISGEGTPSVSDAANRRPTGVLAGEDIDEYELMAFFGNTDQKHKHLLRFGQNNEITAMFGDTTIHPGHPTGTTITAAAGTTNRMVNIFDYIEVPSKFLGSETFLPVATSGADAGNSRNGTLGLGFEAPFHSVPNFRAPGKININTVNDEDVWDALLGYSPGVSYLAFDTGSTSLRSLRGSSASTSPSDFDGVFTSAEGAKFFSPGMTPRGADAGGTIFQTTVPAPPAPPVGEFDFSSSSVNPMKDEVGSPYFRNEIRQRLDSMTTTRSSVFSIWITVGYFDVDEFGRIGGERGSFEGQVTRNRAFYMYDRSIPVAFEPGKDHNIENGILVRTIIQ